MPGPWGAVSMLGPGGHISVGAWVREQRLPFCASFPAGGKVARPEGQKLALSVPGSLAKGGQHARARASVDGCCEPELCVHRPQCTRCPWTVSSNPNLAAIIPTSQVGKLRLELGQAHGASEGPNGKLAPTFALQGPFT